VSDLEVLVGYAGPWALAVAVAGLIVRVQLLAHDVQSLRTIVHSLELAMARARLNGAGHPGRSDESPGR